MPRWKPRSRRSGDRLGATRALVHPLGILSSAGWISTHDVASLHQLDDVRLDAAGCGRGPDRDRRARPRDRRIPPEPRGGRPGPPRRRARGPPLRHDHSLRARRAPRRSRPRTSTRPAHSCSVSSEAWPPTTMSPPGSRPRCAPTSTSTPAAAVPPNGSESTRTRSATGSNRQRRSSGAGSTSARSSSGSRSRSRTLSRDRTD